MMIAALPQPGALDTPARADDEPSLANLLAADARTTSDLRAVAYIAIGIAFTAFALVVKLLAWRAFTAAGAAVAMFGLWCIVDRELRDHPALPAPVRLALRAARGLTIIVGTIAGIVAVSSVFAVAFRGWIS